MSISKLFIEILLKENIFEHGKNFDLARRRRENPNSKEDKWLFFIHKFTEDLDLRKKIILFIEENWPFSIKVLFNNRFLTKNDFFLIIPNYSPFTSLYEEDSDMNFYDIILVKRNILSLKKEYESYGLSLGNIDFVIFGNNKEIIRISYEKFMSL